MIMMILVSQILGLAITKSCSRIWPSIKVDQLCIRSFTLILPMIPHVRLPSQKRTTKNSGLSNMISRLTNKHLRKKLVDNQILSSELRKSSRIQLVRNMLLFTSMMENSEWECSTKNKDPKTKLKKQKLTSTLSSVSTTTLCQFKASLIHSALVLSLPTTSSSSNSSTIIPWPITTFCTMWLTDVLRMIRFIAKLWHAPRRTFHIRVFIMILITKSTLSIDKVKLSISTPLTLVMLNLNKWLI